MELLGHDQGFHQEDVTSTNCGGDLLEEPSIRSASLIARLTGGYIVSCVLHSGANPGPLPPAVSRTGLGFVADVPRRSPAAWDRLISPLVSGAVIEYGLSSGVETFTVTVRNMWLSLAAAHAGALMMCLVLFHNRHVRRSRDESPAARAAGVRPGRRPAKVALCTARQLRR